MTPTFNGEAIFGPCPAITHVEPANARQISAAELREEDGAGRKPAKRRKHGGPEMSEDQSRTARGPGGIQSGDPSIVP